MSENESIPNGSESAEADEICEETPMIDVHAPHGGVHTWKDFWIHLATITIGLLIAISLEQSVEWMHHLHQQHQLEADLREEGVKNKELAEYDWRSMDDGMGATAARLREVESTIAQRKKAKPPFPPASFRLPPPTGHTGFLLLSQAVWETAKESALIDLLPRDVARRYSRLYLRADFVANSEPILKVAAEEAEACRCRFSDGTMPCNADLSQMTDEQLGEYAGLLTKYFILLRTQKGLTLNFEATNEEILNGGSLDDQGELAVRKALDAHPDTFLRPVPETK